MTFAHSTGSESNCDLHLWYDIVYDDDTKVNYECKGTGVDQSCEAMFCESDKLLIEEIVAFLEADNSWTPTTGNTCVKNPPGGTPPDTCCLATLNLFKAGERECGRGYFFTIV